MIMNFIFVLVITLSNTTPLVDAPSDVTACDNYTFNDSVYTESGSYYHNNVQVNNNYSLSFNGNGDNVVVNNSLIFSSNSYTITCDFLVNSYSSCCPGIFS